MTGTEVIRALNRAGLSARLMGEMIVISPANRLTEELAGLVKANREAVVAYLAAFGDLNRVPPGLRGIPYREWVRRQPSSAFREDS